MFNGAYPGKVHAGLQPKIEMHFENTVLLLCQYGFQAVLSYVFSIILMIVLQTGKDLSAFWVGEENNIMLKC